MAFLLFALWFVAQPTHVEDEAQQSTQLVITSWQQVEDDLLKLDYKTLSAKEMRRSELYRQLASTGGLSVYLDMASEGKYPFVALAGFNLVCERYPENAMQAAALAVLFAPRGLIFGLYEGPLRELAKPRDQTVFNDQMATFMAGAHAEELNTDIAIGQLPLRQLHRWFNDGRRITLPARVESIIVERLVIEGPWEQLPITQSLRLELETFAIMPGSPKIRFVIANNEDHFQFRTSLIAVLEDRMLEDGLLRLIVRQRREYIRDKIDIESLKITDERRGKIRDWLAYEPPPAPAIQPHPSDSDAGLEESSEEP